MAEKDFEGQEDVGGGGSKSKPNVANLGSLPIYGKAAKSVKMSKRSAMAVKGKPAKVVAKGTVAKKAYKAAKKGKGKP